MGIFRSPGLIILTRYESTALLHHPLEDTNLPSDRTRQAEEW